MKKVNIKKYLLIVSAFSLIGAGIITLVYWKFFSSSGSENSDILQSIYENNVSFLQNGGNSKSFGRNTLESATAQDSDAGAIWNSDDYKNYNYFKNTVIPGPKSDDCSALLITENQETYENYNYWDDEKYYYKSITYDANGNITSYYLDNDDGYYEYLGGEYAVKKIMDNASVFIGAKEPAFDMAVDIDDEATETVSSVDEDYVEDEQSINDDSKEEIVEDSYYWGEDETVEVITEDGVDYYVITWSYQTDCDSDYMTRSISSSMVSYDEGSEKEDENLSTVYMRYWSTTDDYEIVKQETYLETIGDENLVSTTLIESTSKDVDYSEVSANFNFELDVEVKEIDMRTDYVDAYTDLDGYINFVDQFIVDNNLKIIEPTSDDIEFDYEYINYEYPYLEDYYGYLIDRDFYSDDESGQSNYESAVENYWLKPGSNGYANFNYNNSDYTKSLSVVIFEETISDEDILKNYYNINEDNSLMQKTVIVDGVNMKLWAYSKDSLLSYSSKGSSSEEVYVVDEEIWEGDDYDYADIYILVSKNGFKYLINYFQQDITAEECVLPEFTSNDLTIESNRSDLLSKIRAEYNERAEEIEEPDKEPIIEVDMGDE